MRKEPKIYTQDDYFNDEFPKEKPKQHVELINDNIEEFDKAIKLFKQETLEEAKYKYYKEYWNESHTQEVRSNFLTAFKLGAKWQQEKICDSEVLQRIRASKSDAEARRIIKTI